jgi:ribosome biogenesis GTPase
VSGPERGNADVVAAHGRHVLLRDDDGQTHAAMLRGRRREAVVGDRVVAVPASDDQWVIEAVAPRRNLVRRSDAFRDKPIAANVDLALVVVSGEPRFDEALLLRVLIALAAEGVPSGLIATKSDLAGPTAAIASRLAAHEAIGLIVLRVAMRGEMTGLDAMRQQLAGRRTLLLGQSGMGKSTLVNALVPTAAQQTASISRALNSGRHTTTFTRAFHLPGGGTLIDSPGFQMFEVDHLTRWQVDHAMPEFTTLLGRCRFNDCEHRGEPGCAVAEACDDGRIDALRFRLYRDLIEGRRAQRPGAPRR